ncbi:MAG TPA: hypothetical protein DD687_01980 [Verrucomicrobiales bacterium]|nr:hypothetical protein [Verrucomicrobiales bacterium]
MKMQNLTRCACLVTALLLASSGALNAQASKTARPGGKIPRNLEVQLEKVAGGFTDPVNVVSPRDGSGRLFVVERPGIFKIVKDGEVMRRPFLDIKETVVSSFLEQGLYDMEFHPDFKNNGLFYVHYSDMWFNGDSFIVEYRASSDNPDRADLDSVRVVMQIEQPYSNHNGGELVFGPDGYLYIGSGDGGWEGDVLGAGQDLSTLLAKVLRIDVNTRTTEKGYGIPQDNPFVTPLQQMVLFGVSEERFAEIHPNAQPEIWAYGVRNPVKMQFDNKTGDLYIADVGQNHWEEINFQAGSSKGGENYGWKFMCGTHPFPISAKNAPQVGEMPIGEYSHVTDGICVIGLGVYRGSKYPSMDGVYFVSDWGSGKIWAMERDKDGQWQMQEMLDTQVRPTGAGEDEDGTIYMTSATSNYGGPVDPYDNEPGALWRLVEKSKVKESAETVPLD